ncbi:MAG TPA: class I SAM-dependent methyltransferase [Pyrinomonadaceae bacterium]|jgi:S-adenosylmethionine-diacylgycerolhomoserine-N-methlytransferase
MTDAFESMDKMYRHQRYFYDLTRKYYLLGRDRLLAEIDVRAGENVLEVGCGTGRNLIILAKRFPQANFFGLDASSAMLKTAQAKSDARNLKNATLETALADTFDYRETFDLNEPFDTIFFSYSISMIPVWRESIHNALANLKSGRSFYIVDFYDQKDLPRWFQKILKGWLRKFHVQFWGDLMPYLEDLEKQGVGKLKITSVARRYAFIAEFKKN